MKFPPIRQLLTKVQPLSRPTGLTFYFDTPLFGKRKTIKHIVFEALLDAAPDFLTVADMQRYACERYNRKISWGSLSARVYELWQAGFIQRWDTFTEWDLDCHRVGFGDRGGYGYSMNHYSYKEVG